MENKKDLHDHDEDADMSLLACITENQVPICVPI